MINYWKQIKSSGSNTCPNQQEHYVKFIHSRNRNVAEFSLIYGYYFVVLKKNIKKYTYIRSRNQEEERKRKKNEKK